MMHKTSLFQNTFLSIPLLQRTFKSLNHVFAKQDHKISQIFTPCLGETSYIIESNGEAAIIDPLRDVDDYIDYLKKHNLRLKWIIETHFHADYVSGHYDLAKATGASIVYGPGANSKEKIKNVTDGEILPLGGVKLKALHTPGHTLESTSFVLVDGAGKESSVFTGDTLFAGEVGRPDLLEAINITKEELTSKLYDSIHNKLGKLPDACDVFPGHGPGSPCGKNMSHEIKSTIGKEKSKNYAFQLKDYDSFEKTVLADMPTPPAYFLQNVMLNKNGYQPANEVVEKSVKELTVKECESLIQQGYVIVDTRNGNDYVQGYIPGSINIGIDGMFSIWAASMIKNINTKLILITYEGREKETVIRLGRVGFDNIAGYLKGGVASWEKSGKILKKTSSLGPEAFVNMVKKGEPINILDCRTKGEFNKKHIKNALFIPVTELPEKISNLEKYKNEKLYIYCGSGYRSPIACGILQPKGFDVINVEGGWKEISKYYDL